MHFVANCRSISSHLFTHTSFLTPFLRPGRLKGTFPRLSPRRCPPIRSISTALGGCGERTLRSFSAFAPRSSTKAACFRRFSLHFRSYLHTTTTLSRPHPQKTNESCTPKRARLAAKRQQRRPPQPNEKFDCGGKTKAPSSPQPKKTERTSCAKRMRMNMARG